MIIVDNDIVYGGFYPKDKRGYEGPMYIFRRDQQRSLFYPMNQYFDKLWDSAGPSLNKDDPRLKN